MTIELIKQLLDACYWQSGHGRCCLPCRRV